jgi:anti-sigma B factor antagonist
MLATHAVPRSARLAVDRQDEEGCVTLRVRGEIDLASARVLERELHHVENSAPCRIVLDLAGLDFMDSSGMRLLVAAQRRAQSQDHTLIVANVPHHTRRLLSVTGIDAELLIA